MLPGIRVLLPITLLTVSVLIFALGAAAFLRSAHEDVANAPWRPIETPATARVDLAPPTLAMLRVEPESATAVPTPRGDATPLKVVPAETEIKTPTVAVAVPEASLPRAETNETAAAKSPEPSAAPAQPSAQAIAAPPPEPARDAAPAPTVVEPKAAEPKVSEPRVLETKAADAKATETKPAEAKPAEERPADAKLVDARADEAKPADAKTVETTEPQPAPVVIATLITDKSKQPQSKSAAEPVP